MTWPFGALRPLSYGLIMADPPWKFALRSERGEGRSAQAHYQCMDLPAIQALPVGHLASGDCLLWLWATAPMLREALSTMEAWGYRYVTMGAWAKRSRTGRCWAFGTGYVLRSAAEPFLIGAIGGPKTSKSVRNLIEAPIREHSRKPDAAYTAAEKLIPGAWRCELFGRERRSGWETWGNETTKFGGSDGQDGHDKG